MCCVAASEEMLEANRQLVQQREGQHQESGVERKIVLAVMGEIASMNPKKSGAILKLFLRIKIIGLSYDSIVDFLAKNLKHD